MQIAKGTNYEITAEGRIATCRVWRMPQLSSDEGARCAEEKVLEFEKLARTGRISAMILDLRDAPAIIGPKTQTAMGTMLATFQAAQKPIAVVVGDVAMQRLQFLRLVQENARLHGKVFNSTEDAQRWIMSRSSRPPSSVPRTPAL